MKWSVNSNGYFYSVVVRAIFKKAFFLFLSLFLLVLTFKLITCLNQLHDKSINLQESLVLSDFLFSCIGKRNTDKNITQFES